MRTSAASPFEFRTTMFSKSRTVFSRPSPMILNCIACPASSAPTEPIAACRFCEAIAALTSSDVTPSERIRSGSSQQRMAILRSPWIMTELTPEIRASSSLTCVSAKVETSTSVCAGFEE